MARHKDRFKDLDLDKNGGLDAKELAAGQVTRAWGRVKGANVEDEDLDL